jgi:glutamine amidotransferase
MRVLVIDYKAGNLTSVLKALRHLGAEPIVTDDDLSLVERAERIVLPGVGHFQATERLDATGLTAAIRAAIARGVPFLGICVGMQWLYAGISRSRVRGLLKAQRRCRTWAGTRSK